VNYPESICNHETPGDPLDRQKTITALIMDLTQRQMHICWGNPCSSTYCTYQLDA